MRTQTQEQRGGPRLGKLSPTARKTIESLRTTEQVTDALLIFAKHWREGAEALDRHAIDNDKMGMPEIARHSRELAVKRRAHAAQLEQIVAEQRAPMMPPPAAPVSGKIAAVKIEMEGEFPGKHAFVAPDVWTKADQFLLPLARRAPPGHAYTKVFFKIHWADGESYDGRIDLQRERHGQQTEILARHVREMALSRAGRRKPPEMSLDRYTQLVRTMGGIAEWERLIEKYDIPGMPDPLPPPIVRENGSARQDPDLYTVWRQSKDPLYGWNWRRRDTDEQGYGYRTRQSAIEAAKRHEQTGQK